MKEERDRDRKITKKNYSGWNVMIPDSNSNPHEEITSTNEGIVKMFFLSPDVKAYVVHYLK